jgi:hypothetical protein
MAGRDIIGIEPLTIVFGNVSLILSLKVVTFPFRRELNDANELELDFIRLKALTVLLSLSVGEPLRDSDLRLLFEVTDARDIFYTEETTCIIFDRDHINRLEKNMRKM